jgi:DnaJ-class molecular chaperone
MCQALKWHPDRHQDAAQKELAEQKFVEVWR